MIYLGCDVLACFVSGVRRRKQNYSLEYKSKYANYRKTGKGGPVNNMQRVSIATPF